MTQRHLDPTDYDRRGDRIACRHSGHYAADGLPECKGDSCTGHTIGCGQGSIVCQRHTDRLTQPVVTLVTSKGQQVITCGGPNEAANLALTLVGDGWTATVDPATYAWAQDPANFDQANSWGVKAATR